VDISVRGQVAAFDLIAANPLVFANDTILRIGSRAQFDGGVVVTNSTWQGGAIFFNGETEILRAAGLTDQAWNKQGHLKRGPNANITLFNSSGSFLPGAIRNLPGGTWEMIDSQIFIPN